MKKVVQNAVPDYLRTQDGPNTIGIIDTICRFSVITGGKEQIGVEIVKPLFDEK